MLEVLADFVLLIVILICLVTDLRERRIYNKIVFPAVAAGIILNTAHFGLFGLRTSMTGLLVGVLLFIVPFALYAALGTALIGGVIAVLVLIWQSRLLSTLRRLGTALGVLVGGGGKGAALFMERTPYSSLIPYGVPIFLGTIAAYLVS